MSAPNIESTLHEFLYLRILNAPPDTDRVRIAGDLVQLQALPGMTELIAASPILSHIVDDIAADLEMENGSVIYLWDELVDVSAAYIEGSTNQVQ